MATIIAKKKYLAAAVGEGGCALADQRPALGVRLGPTTKHDITSI